jgi:hypothetical protein
MHCTLALYLHISYARAQMTDEAAVAWALGVLGKIYGDKVVEPTRHYVTRWGQDEYSRGSYSYVATGAVPEDMDSLAEPLRGRLFFAGEATNRMHPATVHGALLSGIHAARLVEEVRNPIRQTEDKQHPSGTKDGGPPRGTCCAICGYDARGAQTSTKLPTPVVVPAATQVVLPTGLQPAASGAAEVTNGTIAAAPPSASPAEPSSPKYPFEGKMIGAFVEKVREKGAKAPRQRSSSKSKKRTRSSAPLSTTTTKHLWVHENCAAYAPEVAEENGRWFNVVDAVKRGRKLKCTTCRQAGATVGCFNEKCQRSYHAWYVSHAHACTHTHHSHHSHHSHNEHPHTRIGAPLRPIGTSVSLRRAKFTTARSTGQRVAGSLRLVVVPPNRAQGLVEVGGGTDPGRG